MVNDGGIAGFLYRIIRWRIVRLWGRVPFPALAAAVCLLFAAAGVAVVDDYGISTDEWAQRNIADANADYIMGDRDALPTDHNRYYGIAFELPALLVERVLGLRDIRHIIINRHLLTHLFFIAGGFFCGLLAYRMLGSRWAGLLAMLLFLLHPRLYAHSFFNSKDIPFAVMFVIALYLMHRAFRRDTIGAFVLLGAVVGVAVNMRPFALLLLPAALAMRGLDWRFASDPRRRKHILITGGVFAAAVLAAIYLSQPYYWENPLRFIEGLRVLSQHPFPVLNLFQGQFIFSYEVPAHYLPVWFGITAPPLALLLGAAGALAVCWRGWRSPGRIFRRGELRFLLALLSCFALPIVAIVVLESNLYNGWRQMYFLWAPFCLLAAAGWRWLAGNAGMRAGGKPGGYLNPARRAGAYVLAGAGLSGVIMTVVSLHPHQHIYFNRLADRDMEGQIREQFDLDYWGVSYRQGIKYLLERYPQLPIYIDAEYLAIHRNWNILTEADRGRVFIVTEGADFHMANDFSLNKRKLWDHQDSSLAEVAEIRLPGPVLHRIKAYGSTMLTITAPGLSDRSPADLIANYRAKYQDITSNELVADAGFEVYISNDSRVLYYAKTGCETGDWSPQFYVHILPINAGDLPPDRRQHGFDSLNFAFLRQGGRVDDKCWAAAPLPDYPIARIHTGQFASGSGTLWGAGVNLSVFTRFQEIEADLAGWQPIASGIFDLYWDGDRLVYHKDPCAAGDTQARFYLHTFPADINRLPAERREHGFGNLSFEFGEHGAHRGGKCLASVGLPDYAIERIRTGQFVAGEGQLWRAEFAVGE